MKNKIHTRFWVILWSIFVFVLPLHNILVSWLTVAVIAWYIFSGNYKIKWQVLLANKQFWIIYAFYLLHFVGLLYTEPENLNKGWFSIQVKTSLLLFPIIIAYAYPKIKGKIEKPFIWGCLLMVLLKSTIAFYWATSIGNYNLLTYTALSNSKIFNFTLTAHPSYLALYINLATTMLLFLPYKTVFANSYLKNFIILIFTTFIFMLNSKAGIMVQFFIIFSYIIYIIHKKKTYWLGSITAVAIISLFLIVIVFVPAINTRFKQTIAGLNTDKKQYAYSTYVRMGVWKSTLELIYENSIKGVGTGNLEMALQKKYIQNNQTKALQNNLNVHNQFLQSFVLLGFIGFISMLLIFILPLIQFIKQKHLLGIFFLGICIIHFMFESMLCAQAGVVFFSFFYAYYYKNKLSNNTSINK